MKKIFYLGFMVLALMFITSCVSNRNLVIGGYTVNEQDFGGCEIWYAVDKYNRDDLIEKIRFQVGYFRSNKAGFILYEYGNVGEKACFSRHGLDLRWDWGEYEIDGSPCYRYSFVIKPDGTGLYYDFSISDDGVSKPRDIYKCKGSKIQNLSCGVEQDHGRIEMRDYYLCTNLKWLEDRDKWKNFRSALSFWPAPIVCFPEVLQLQPGTYLDAAQSARVCTLRTNQ